MGRCKRTSFLHIVTSGNKPLKLIPMDLEFPVIPGFI